MFRVLITCSVILVVDWSRAEDAVITAPESTESVVVKESLEPRSSNLPVEGLASPVETVVPNSEAEPTAREGRYLCKKKKKGKMKQNKYIIPLLFGWLLIKSILIPIALKGLALMSGGSLMLSLLSLVLAAIMGLRRLISTGMSLAAPFSGTAPTGYSKYRRKDLMEEEGPYEPADPYKYYRDKYDNNRR